MAVRNYKQIQKMKLKISKKTINNLWWLIISVDYDYSRLTIADHSLTTDSLTLWLEDKNDFKNTIDECLQLDISVKDFTKVIKSENLNSYEATKMHPTKNFAYNCRIQISEPIKWYNEDASPTEQQWAREAVLKFVLHQLIEKYI